MPAACRTGLLQLQAGRAVGCLDTPAALAATVRSDAAHDRSPQSQKPVGADRGHAPADLAVGRDQPPEPRGLVAGEPAGVLFRGPVAGDLSALCLLPDGLLAVRPVPGHAPVWLPLHLLGNASGLLVSGRPCAGPQPLRPSGAFLFWLAAGLPAARVAATIGRAQRRVAGDPQPRGGDGHERALRTGGAS